MKYKSVKGMEDVLPEDVGIWRFLEGTARTELESYGFKEIRTPIIEETDVFTRSIGETTDIVKKEMYTFADRKGRSLTLRPEGTAPIVRAYIEHSFHNKDANARLYYIGPMFRSERPQKGRTRQFHQIGVEVFGSGSPFTDAEVITQLKNMLVTFGLDDFVIKLNSLGCDKDKERFSKVLGKHILDKKDKLCEDCKGRLKTNVLRILDCKNTSCRDVVKSAPLVTENLCIPCKDHFEALKNTLKSLKVEYEETENLVRGLDYYTGTVFEVTHPALGAQDAIGAGGRYDNLVKDMGGVSTPAIGYALGIERLILALKAKNTPSSVEAKSVIYIGTMGEPAKLEGLKLALEIRGVLKSVTVMTSTAESSIKSQMRSADSSGAKFVLIIGASEMEKGVVALKNMVSKEQIEILRSEIINKLKGQI